MKKEHSIEEIKYELMKLKERSNFRTLLVVLISIIVVGLAIAAIVYKLKNKCSCNCVADDYDDFDDDDYIDYEDDDEVFEDYRAADFEGQED